MRIATWNIDRLHKSISEIEKQIEIVNADILVLTETDSRLQLKYPYSCFSSKLCELDSALYSATESRIAIYSKFPVASQLQTYNSYETLAVEIMSENSRFLIYGIVMGAFGNRRPEFIGEVQNQMRDIERFYYKKKAICVCGDFNLSFSDNYYFTEKGRRTVLEAFSKYELNISTAGQKECIDHIAVSESLLKNHKIIVGEWNHNKKLSDHKGVYVDITPEI